MNVLLKQNNDVRSQNLLQYVGRVIAFLLGDQQESKYSGQSLAWCPRCILVFFYDYMYYSIVYLFVGEKFYIEKTDKMRHTSTLSWRSHLLTWSVASCLCFKFAWNLPERSHYFANTRRQCDFDNPAKELFFWAVLFNRRELAYLFWKSGKDQIGDCWIFKPILPAIDLRWRLGYYIFRRCTDGVGSSEVFGTSCRERRRNWSQSRPTWTFQVIKKTTSFIRVILVTDWLSTFPYL